MMRTRQTDVRALAGARPHLAFAIAAVLLALAAIAPSAGAQRTPPARETVEDNGAKLVQLDFDDVELAAVIEAIAKLTNKNFIYDDRVRGRVTIVSPTQVTVDQAYAVFESVLQVKGFSTVPGPGGVIKVVPVREVKESSIETVREGEPSPNRDHFVTRLIPLRYIDATEISNTLKPLVSKDAALIAYAPTNTLILTDSSSNIRRLLDILGSIDISSYREELAVIPIEYADATTLGDQISEIYGAEVSAVAGSVRRSTRRAVNRGAEQANPQLAPGIRVRILPDTRTNSLIVLAPRQQIQDVRELVEKLDVRVSGAGTIHVYYLRHADAEELAQTLNSLLSGQSNTSTPGATGAAGAPGAGNPALRSVVTELAEGITVTADPGTNSLVIQASREGYETLVKVIEQLDVQRPQVLVEALIMEVDVSDGLELGLNALVEAMSNKWNVDLKQVTNDVTAGAIDGMAGAVTGGPLAVNAVGTSGNTKIQAILHAAASDGTTNVISAPHILTSDNEEAEIRIGNNIPIVTSRLEGATGGNNLSTSVNVERQDIGVTLRVTPQISEGDTLRLKLFQELSDVNTGLSASAALTEDSGPALTNTRIENTLVVSNGETVVIGGLLSDNTKDETTKIPFLGDIPFLGWAFKTTSTQKTKQNLLVFLTPHIIRSREDLERATIRKREQFGEAAGPPLALEKDDRARAEESGIDLAMARGQNPVLATVRSHRTRYPLERMQELERSTGLAAGNLSIAQTSQRYAVRAGVFTDEGAATDALARVVDAGHDAALVTSEANGALVFELRVGPYPSLDAAQTASALLRGGLGLDASVEILPPDGARDPLREDAP
ncbi:MAG: type II secretion system secretin GspD [Myxococcota bacterium]